MISHHAGSIMLQLREAAKVEYNEVIRNGMKAAADAVSLALASFKASPTGETLADLNGAWSRGCCWLGASGGYRDPGSQTAVAA